MNAGTLHLRLLELIEEGMPLPGSGHTVIRHQRLREVGREDLSLARLFEAHCDAVAIMAEAGRSPRKNNLYGVWASEKPDQLLSLQNMRITGRKMFCSGAGIVDRALITVSSPEQQLIDCDVTDKTFISFDHSSWQTTAFEETKTATATFHAMPVSLDDGIGDPGFYLQRVGFWHGACGPAACWAGGADGLLAFAMKQVRDDAHTLAHLGAIYASIWALDAYLQTSALEIDRGTDTFLTAHKRALTLRHLVEQACTDVLRRVARAYGPHPLAMDREVSRRYRELDLYLRQSHAERDLEALGRLLKL